MKLTIFFLLTILFVNTVWAQSEKNHIRTDSISDAGYLAQYLMWGDTKIVAALETLTEEEFNRPFEELSGNIHSKTAHILSIYEFFVAILENRPHSEFPSFDHLTKDQLISKWKEILITWPQKTENIQTGLFALPLANNQRVDVQHIYFDALLHTIYHRGQIITFIRLLGKSKEDLHPRELNTDYLNYVFTEKRHFIHSAKSD